MVDPSQEVIVSANAWGSERRSDHACLSQGSDCGRFARCDSVQMHVEEVWDGVTRLPRSILASHAVSTSVSGQIVQSVPRSYAAVVGCRENLTRNRYHCYQQGISHQPETLHPAGRSKSVVVSSVGVRMAE